MGWRGLWNQIPAPSGWGCGLALQSAPPKMGGPPCSADSVGHRLAASELRNSATAPRIVSVTTLSPFPSSYLNTRASPSKQKNLLAALVRALWGPVTEETFSPSQPSISWLAPALSAKRRVSWLAVFTTDLLNKIARGQRGPSEARTCLQRGALPHFVNFMSMGGGEGQGWGDLRPHKGRLASLT